MKSLRRRVPGEMLLRAVMEGRGRRRTRALSWAANAHVQAAAPWAALHGDRLAAAFATRSALRLIEICASVAWSIIPDLAASAIIAAGGTASASSPAWPDDIESRLLDDRGTGTVLPASFAPVAKLNAEHVASLCQSGERQEAAENSARSAMGQEPMRSKLRVSASGQGANVRLWRAASVVAACGAQRR